MTRLTFSTQPKSLLRGSHCLVIATCERVENGLELLPADLSRLLAELAMEAKGALSGPINSTLTSSEIRRLSFGPLPGPGSRYNCPARPEAIAQIVQTFNGAGNTRGSLIICLEDKTHLEATLTGLARGLPMFNRRSNQNPEHRLQIVVLDPEGVPMRIPQDERSRVRAIRDAAFLVDKPPSELNPEAFAHEAKKSIEEVDRVTVKEIVGPALARQNLGGIYAVGQGATKAPRLLIATYRPARPKGPHTALIGKGVTFDTGGLHLKGRGHMEGMKCDMGGAAAVFGAFRLLTEIGVPMQLSLLLCLAENAIGPASYKPDDIITLHSGKTVEINNTDAEGRLLIADGLSYAARSLGAAVVLDAATLTGAQLIATGGQHAAVVSNDAELEAKLVESGRQSGDLVHPLPFAPEFYQAEFKSPVADMRNSVKNRSNAQPSCAAQFLWAHIDSMNVRWAHIDLAGPAWQSERGTGFGVSILARTVRHLS